MSDKRARGGEKLFVRAFKFSLLRSLPFALIPVTGWLICLICGMTDGIYIGVYITACVLSLICALGTNLLFMYRAFPRKADGNSASICSSILLSGFLSSLASLLCAFAFAAVCGASVGEGIAYGIFYTLKHNFTALFIAFVSALMLSQTVFTASALAVLWGKRKKKSFISRTCRAAVPIFTLLAIYHALMLILFTYTDMSYAANLASEHFLNENAIWLVTVLIPISAPALTALHLLCRKTANKLIIK